MKDNAQGTLKIKKKIDGSVSRLIDLFLYSIYI